MSLRESDERFDVRPLFRGSAATSTSRFMLCPFPRCSGPVAAVLTASIVRAG
jgi:hypothetical protein